MNVRIYQSTKHCITTTTDPCAKCGEKAKCSVSHSGEAECSCQDNFPFGDPLSECSGSFTLRSTLILRYKTLSNLKN